MGPLPPWISSFWLPTNTRLVALWSFALSLLTLGPLLGPGYWLWADAVSVPRSHLTDQALGLGDTAPRATPQDGALAVLSAIVDGGLLAKAITLLALVAAGTGAARLVRAFLPVGAATSLVPQLAAATFVIDNLWVVERLSQGQWSLLVGYGALGHAAVVAARLREKSPWRDWAELGFWLAAGGLVPTGALFVAVLAGAVLAAPGGARWFARVALFVGLLLVAAGPWVSAGLFGLSREELGDGGAAGAVAFATRLGRGEWLALGGIWNAHDVPGSQHGVFGLAVDLALVALVMVGTVLLRQRLREDRVLAVLFGLALVVVVLVGLSATGLAQSALTQALTEAPSLGIFRDGQKWAALAWPAYALALAAVAARGRTAALAAPRHFRLGLPALFVLAPLLLIPDGLWGVGGTLAPVRYPAGWFEVREAVAALPSRGVLLTVPVGITRRYGWAGGRVSIDPVPRLVPVPVAQTGDLLVDRTVVPGEGALARRAMVDLLAGAEPERFAKDTVGWVLVERDQIGELPASAKVALDRFQPVFVDRDFTLYRNPVPPLPAPSVFGARRHIVLLAHFAWAALLGLGAVGSLWRRVRAQVGL